MDITPFIISAKTAVSATVIVFILGIAAAYFVGKTGRLSPVFDSAFTLSMVLPPTVVGFFLLVFFGKNSCVGSFLSNIGIQIVFTWYGAVLASVCAGFPLMYRTTRGAFEQLDRDMINAARTLGMSESEIFLKVMLPNSMPGIAAGTVLAFARSLGEFGATIMLAGNIKGKTQTIAIAVYQAVQNGNRPLAYRYAFVMIIISFVCMFLINFINQIQMKKSKGR